MSVNILICDDSSLARKQLARALPKDWDANVTYAQHGQEALDIINSSSVDIMFLDLNMPVLDGYQTLQGLQGKANAPVVVVVSGDVQPLAIKRVSDLGALDFLKKPVSSDILLDTLSDLSIFKDRTSDGNNGLNLGDLKEKLTLTSGLQEVANVSMGRAASVLADMLNVFIKLPVPQVNVLEVSELQMALSYGGKEQGQCSAVTQGFVGAGISIETLLIFSDSSFPDMAKLLGMSETIDHTMELELLMDISSVLVGPFMAALSQQLNIEFSRSHPAVLGQHIKVQDLVGVKKSSLKQTLAVEIVYEVENYKISCDLLLLFTEDSLEPLERLLSYLID
ncbi:response regulator [Marinomonas mediterranea]|jgi:Response regulator containing CheY-like receiver domain and AraC-type DNA-binding domain|uniref:Response regulator receiver protein n=1 Tax=Marinomonas mediterranea (strain ATCC 700492 / JCM 21426 / NBRC 103028 / MMB-1) TaxID=717774 RepID=F2JVA5_MARM1|nr:response regulator [Marinomonas mediterranea]ADZ92863.1 response regulator receiver protein [Marinomonas mediterranea MMB-1]WCN10796.1 response regulator [Marinomonas mediterranea]WCN14853.1 response regulator [Marinomonas mediterranea]WCN18885.1 response regulator [Marinomonas mediterranea MMB-1]